MGLGKTRRDLGGLGKLGGLGGLGKTRGDYGNWGDQGGSTSDPVASLGEWAPTALCVLFVPLTTPSVVSKLKVEFNYSTIGISLSMFSKTLYQRVFECQEFESGVNFN